MDRANKAAILMLALGIGIFVGNAKASMWNNPHGGATAQNVRYTAIVEAPKSLVRPSSCLFFQRSWNYCANLRICPTVSLSQAVVSIDSFNSN
ncbi:hypothetical protein [Candidatus Coxiella mudrowiae]|uniref:hypothetical protein n=1 Tax=Candidatus Coxiella mudrowiae TaxID=2054173 RepID=UPI001FD5D897|nr:hypothetical protein [Candidatus Coxiella mudrowiae]